MADGQAGFCFIRQNHGGTLVQLGYGRSTGFAIDPIEKKPLNHFFPGTPVLSFGTAGCNLGCKFCQNWDISKAKLDEQGLRRNTPADVVDLAIAQGAPSIAYTYNDPVIWAEYVVDIAREARRRGVANVLVTAGYVTDEARPELYADADESSGIPRDPQGPSPRLRSLARHPRASGRSRLRRPRAATWIGTTELSRAGRRTALSAPDPGSLPA